MKNFLQFLEEKRKESLSQAQIDIMRKILGNAAIPSKKEDIKGVESKLRGLDKVDLKKLIVANIPYVSTMANALAHERNL
jgi:hypothetical protein